MVVIGDTEGHDKLCGWYNSYASQVQRVYCHCNIPKMECDNAFYLWWHLLPDDVHGHNQWHNWAIIDWSDDSNKELKERVFIPD
jgi:hypothetical protein